MLCEPTNFKNTTSIRMLHVYSTTFKIVVFFCKSIEINNNIKGKIQSKYGHFPYMVDSLCEPILGEKIICLDVALKANILRANAWHILFSHIFAGYLLHISFNSDQYQEHYSRKCYLYRGSFLGISMNLIFKNHVIGHPVYGL